MGASVSQYVEEGVPLPHGGGSQGTAGDLGSLAMPGDEEPSGYS